VNNETRRSCQVALDGYRGRFFGSPCVPSPVSGIRTPNLPLLPVWEKGAGGDEGQRRPGMQKITHLSQEIYP